MVKTVQISILARIYGNVNADETIGNRITIKKFYSSEGEVLPFVSARAIKYAIREALKNLGFEIDPFIIEKIMRDSGDPIKYIDNDLFGFMVPVGNKGSITRQAPIAISYFKALRNTPITVEFGGRFPRDNTSKINNKKSEDESEDVNPEPFEIEVADFIGRLNVLIYDYIGKFTEEELGKVSDKSKLIKQGDYYVLPKDEREKRLRAFLDVLLTPKYVLPRRTNSLNIPEYKVAVIVLNNDGVLPIYQYVDYTKYGEIDTEKLNKLINICNEAKSDILVIDYENWVKNITVQKVSVVEAINKIVNHILGDEK